MKNFVREWGLFIGVFLAVLMFRFFFWFAVKVDGHSMDPTLAPNERLVVVKHTKLQHGDIVVANEVNQLTGKSKSIVKRVIGLPGDRLSFDDDTLQINGRVVNEAYLERYQKAFEVDKLQTIYRGNDFFMEQASESPAFTARDGQAKFEVEVPLGQYYLMGDDRVVSSDSRAVGSFSEDSILGEVKLRYWPFDRVTTFP